MTSKFVFAFASSVRIKGINRIVRNKLDNNTKSIVYSPVYIYVNSVFFCFCILYFYLVDF